MAEVIRTGLLRVLKEYDAARQDKGKFNKDHPLVRFLERDFPNQLADLLQPPLKPQGSAGQGKWASIPWVATYDPHYGSLPGHLVVDFLFRGDLDGVYLSLNQHGKSVQEQAGSKTKEILRTRADEFRAKLGDSAARYRDDVNLSTATSDFAPLYEAGNVCARYYSRISLPSEQELVDDYREILRLYSILAPMQEEANLERASRARTAKAHAQPLVFFNVGWMREYKGLANDTIQGGGQFVKTHGFGHEMFNFFEEDGWIYGFVRSGQGTGGVELQRLGAPRGAPAIDRAVVVWTSAHPAEKGRRIIGWYLDATVYAVYQKPLPNTHRSFQNKPFGFVAKAPASQAILLPEEERTFSVPRKKGFMGQSNIWYADSPEGQAFASHVLEYISSTDRAPVGIDPVIRKHLARQPALEKRLKVEASAIEAVRKLFLSLGYRVDDKQKDKLGWDLEAHRKSEWLLLEVKGSSLKAATVELTPQEYEKMQKHRDVYRLCIVEDALSGSPLPRVFHYDTAAEAWRSQEGDVLGLEEITVVQARAWVMR